MYAFVGQGVSKRGKQVPFFGSKEAAIEWHEQWLLDELHRHPVFKSVECVQPPSFAWCTDSVRQLVPASCSASLQNGSLVCKRYMACSMICEGTIRETEGSHYALLGCVCGTRRRSVAAAPGIKALLRSWSRATVWPHPSLWQGMEESILAALPTLPTRRLRAPDRPPKGRYMLSPHRPFPFPTPHHNLRCSFAKHLAALGIVLPEGASQSSMPSEFHPQPLHVQSALPDHLEDYAADDDATARLIEVGGKRKRQAAEQPKGDRPIRPPPAHYERVRLQPVLFP